MVSVTASLFLRQSNTNPIMMITISTTIIAPPAAHIAPITWGAVMNKECLLMQFRKQNIKEKNLRT